MKVLLWSQYFWPENFRINELTTALSNSGRSITVLTGKPNYPDGRVFPGYRIFGVQRETFSGAEVVRIPILPRGSGSLFRLGLNYLSFILSGYVFAPFALRSKDFDVVFVYAPSPLLQTLPALFLAWLKRAPLIVWVQDLWPEALSATGHVRNPMVLRLVKVLVRYIYRHADLILIQSEAFREPVARLTSDVSKIRFLPNSADLHDTVPRGSEMAHLLAQAMHEDFAVLFAGNVGHAQAIDTIVEAAEMLRNESDIRFYIVGSGSRTEWIAAEINKRKLENLVLPGRFPSDDMPCIMEAASALLVTLVDDPVGNHTIPSKLQAYLASGRPIIASMNGEGARIVKDSNAGIVCPAENVDALVDAVMKLRHMSKKEREHLGQNGKRYFMEYFESTRLTGELVSHLSLCQKKKVGSKG